MTKHAFIFPGQGAQHVGMGKELYESDPEIKSLFDRSNEILGYSLSDVCFSGPVDEINRTNRSQPALFVCSIAALESLKKKQPELVEQASCSAGLSLGEYTAMVFAGAISFEDALRLVQERGDAMQAAADEVSSSMVSVLGLDLDKVEQVCQSARQGEEILQVANHLCPGNIVVSGHQSACDRVDEVAREAGAMRAVELAVAGAFHTPLMASALERLKTALTETKIQSPSVPVISNVDAKSHESPDEIRELLVRQVCSPVLWEQSMNQMLAEGVEQFYEIGPGKVLKGLLKRINRKVPCDLVPA